MTLTINTNISSLIAQKNLNSATDALNESIQRMSTGYKINSASDDAAGYSIAKSWSVKISSLDIASQNASMGSDLLTTAEENCSLIETHLQRIRDLTEQAANGTYGDSSRTAIESEISSRLTEIARIQSNAEYNGIKLMDGAGTAINLQVGIDSTAANSQIQLGASLFSALDLTKITADKCSASATASAQLDEIDAVISTLSSRVTNIGAAQNRVDSAIESIEIQSQNLTSSLSTIQDTDVAAESSNYIKAQILQQASATLLSTANQLPSIALNLI
jgi:flagellin